MKLADATAAEELVHRHLLDKLPVWSVGRKSQGRIVGYAFDGGGLNAGYEGEFMGFEELFCELGRGHDDAWDGAETERKYGAKPEREGLERAVDERAKEMEVANYGQSKGAWREEVLNTVSVA